MAKRIQNINEEGGEPEVVTFTFTLNPTPADAKVVLNGTEGKVVTVNEGEEVSWEVSKKDYITQSGKETVTKDTVKDIVLKLDEVTFSINPTPSDAKVVINGAEQKSVKIIKGQKATWTVSKQNYISQNGEETVNADLNKNVELKLDEVTFSIAPTPTDAKVVINGKEQKSLKVVRGDKVSYEVSKKDYITQKGDEVVDKDINKTITLKLDEVNFAIKATPANAKVMIDGKTQSSAKVVKGASVKWNVELQGYNSQSETEKVDKDTTKEITLVINEEEAENDGNLYWVTNILKRHPDYEKLYIDEFTGVYKEDTKPHIRGNAILYKNKFYKN